MFNQAWDETLLNLDSDLDEHVHVLENLCERQVKMPTLVKNAMTHHISKTLVGKGAEKLPDIEDHGKRHRRTATAEHMLISQKKSVQETEQHQHTLRKELKRKARLVDLGGQTARVRKAENGLSKITR